MILARYNVAAHDVKHRFPAVETDIARIAVYSVPVPVDAGEERDSTRSVVLAAAADDGVP